MNLLIQLLLPFSAVSFCRAPFKNTIPGCQIQNWKNTKTFLEIHKNVDVDSLRIYISKKGISWRLLEILLIGEKSTGEKVRLIRG